MTQSDPDPIGQADLICAGCNDDWPCSFERGRRAEYAHLAGRDMTTLHTKSDPLVPRNVLADALDSIDLDVTQSDPTPLDVERFRRVARAALNTWVGRNWPSMDAMRRDGIGSGLVEKSGKPDQAIRRFIDTFQPDFVLDLLDRLAALPTTPTPEPHDCPDEPPTPETRRLYCRGCLSYFRLVAATLRRYPMTEDTVSRPDPFREQADAYTRLSEEYTAYVLRARAIEEAARAFVNDWEGLMDEGDDQYIDALRAALEGAPHD